MYGASAATKVRALEEELDRTFQGVGQRERPSLVSRSRGSKGK
jgi:hypothetical protein